MKNIKEIELLINKNNLQEAVHMINNLADSILDKDIDCNFMINISTTFIQKDMIIDFIDKGDKISKKSEIKNIDDIKDNTYYYWECTTKRTFRVYEITKEKLNKILESIKNFLVDYSVAV